MEDIKVSVIVPVYNGEKILEKNLLMLSKQTLKEIEFVLVNDGSRDNSLNILKAFKEAFPDKFTVVNSEKNRGPGGARNIGLSYAKGEYIGFMDQDDYAHPDMFKSLYERAKKDGCDIVSCGYRNQQTGKDCFPYDINGILDDEKRLELCQEILYIWNKIYRRDMLEKMSMNFREGVANDDTDFCIEAFLRAEKAGAIGRCYYFYTFNKDSITRNKEVDVSKQLREAEDLLKTLKKRIFAAGMERLYPKALDVVLNVYSKGILKFIFDKEDFSFSDYEKYLEIFDEYKEYMLKFKKKDSNLLQEVVFNQITDNPAESYEKMMRIKRRLQ